MLEIGLLAALYYGSAKLGYELGFSGPVAAIVWLPVGVGIAYLYLRGLAFWPGVLLGDLLANDYMRLPVGTALAQTVGNVLEVVLAAYLLRRAARSGYLLGRVDGARAPLAASGAGDDGERNRGDAGVAGGRCGQFGRVLDRVAHVVAG